MLKFLLDAGCDNPPKSPKKTSLKKCGLHLFVSSQSILCNNGEKWDIFIRGQQRGPRMNIAQFGHTLRRFTIFRNRYFEKKIFLFKIRPIFCFFFYLPRSFTSTFSIEQGRKLLSYAWMFRLDETSNPWVENFHYTNYRSRICRVSLINNSGKSYSKNENNSNGFYSKSLDLFPKLNFAWKHTPEKRQFSRIWMTYFCIQSV